MTDKKQDKITYLQFRDQQIKTYRCPDATTAQDWQQQRAILQRQAFIEHDIRAKWEKLKDC